MTHAVLIALLLTAAAAYFRLNQRYRQEVDRKERDEAERARVLECLAGDFRNPLNAATGLCDLLEEGLNPQQRRQVAGIRASLHTLLSLASASLVYFGESVTPRPTRVALSDLIEDIGADRQLIATAKGLHFETHIEPGSPDQVEIDGEALRQILSHLLDHALGITQRGHVEVTLHEVAADEMLTIAVDDTGPSLSAETRIAQFRPYGLEGRIPGGNPPGTGLHLFVARTIAQRLGGDLLCSARPSEGCVYTLRVPAIIHTRTASGKPVSGGNLVQLNDLYARHRAQVSPKKVLVAEDQPSNQHVIVQALESGDHAVTLVNTGDAALEALADESFDLAVVDLRLPGTSGLDVIKLGRLTHARHMPFIVLTGETSEKVRQECLDAGAWAYLTKPVSSRRLLDTVVAVCERASALADAPRQAKMDIGLLHSPMGQAVATGEPTRVVIESMRDALRYVSEFERAAVARDWQSALTRVHAMRGAAYIVSARRVLLVCSRILALPPDELHANWRTHHRDLVDSLDESRREMTTLFARAIEH